MFRTRSSLEEANGIVSEVVVVIQIRIDNEEDRIKAMGLFSLFLGVIALAAFYLWWQVFPGPNFFFILFSLSGTIAIILGLGSFYYKRSKTALLGIIFAISSVIGFGVYARTLIF